MADTTDPREMFEIADQDLNSAVYLTGMRPLPLEVICNLCQQAGEKYLKSFLLSKNVDPPKIHALTVLLEKCASFDTSFAANTAKCAFLENFAVIPRYGFDLQITEDDMRTAIRYAADMKEFVKAAQTGTMG